MASVDPLLLAATAYATDRWTQDDWREFGHETGTTDLVTGHDRLLRSLGFNDPDYPAAASFVLRQVLSEAVDPGDGESGRMEVLVEAMPDLPEWVEKNAPKRVKRLFDDYLAARVAEEIPNEWREAAHQPQSEFSEWDPTPVAPWETTAGAIPASAPASKNLTSLTGTAAEPAPSAAQAAVTPVEEDIFIVHGHDTAAMNSIRIYVQQKTGKLPVSLAEQPGKGKTIIEKFESHGAKTAFVIVLMSPDDVGQTKGAYDDGDDPSARARQNVVLELGYFYASVGRDKVVVMDGGVERPSDLAGVSYIEYPGTNWKDELRNELVEARLAI